MEKEKLDSMNVMELSAEDLMCTDGGWMDPWNMVHRKYPFVAGVLDFFEGVSDGFAKGAA